MEYDGIRKSSDQASGPNLVLSQVTSLPDHRSTHQHMSPQPPVLHGIAQKGVFTCVSCVYQFTNANDAV